jgi:FHA domain
MLQIVLLAGKFVFLIILFLFIYRVIRSSTRELRAAAPGPAARQYTAPPVAAATLETPSAPYAASLNGGGVWTLVVERSPVLRPGEAYAFEPGMPALVGRSSDMDIHLEDTFVSSKHVLFEATASGLLAEDLLSTNGTQVNGADISQPTLLSPGDRVEVGDTIFRVEVR